VVKALSSSDIAEKYNRLLDKPAIPVSSVILFCINSLVIVLTGGLLDVGDNLLKHDFSQISRNVIESLRKGIYDRLQNIEYSNTLAVCTFLDPRFKVCVFKNKDTSYILVLL
jgi:hypothetical protein